MDQSCSGGLDYTEVCRFRKCYFQCMWKYVSVCTFSANVKVDVKAMNDDCV